MLSIPDLAIIGGIALLVFGPEQLPKVARKVGHVMRDVRSTSESFMREMERAADDTPPPYSRPFDSPQYDPPYATPAHEPPATSPPPPMPYMIGPRPADLTAEKSAGGELPPTI